MKNKKIILAIIGIIAIVLVTIGITYAYWLVTKTQTNSSVLTAGCLDITLDGEANDINLTNQFPLSDEEGMELTPYEFTVTNNCNTAVDYYLNLESIGDSTNAISADAIKVALNDNISILSTNDEREPTISGAYSSNRLAIGSLEASSAEHTNDSISYKLRIWIDADAPISEMNKTFQSKISVTVGQGINNPLKVGTLAYDIVSNYNGADAIKTISTKWTETTPVDIAKGLWSNSSYYWGTEYELDSETGYYKLAGDIVQATVAECRATEGLCGKYLLISTTETRFMYVVSSFTNASNPDTDSQTYITAQMIKSKNEFSTVTLDGVGGLYAAADDLGTSYYFRGDVTDNYVQFGAYTSGTTTEETPMYWRIVRVNGDGTIRLAYDGTTKSENGVAHSSNIGTTVYNSVLKYGGYTYDDGTGEQIDSTIKGVVDTWYNNRLKTKYGKYIADGIFCNDREVTEITSYGSQQYGAYTRLYTNKYPKLTCTREEDRYTTSKEIGNGLLTNPIGLITADEVAMAGGIWSESNTEYYLYNGEHYWTMSLSSFKSNTVMPIAAADTGSLYSLNANIGESSMGARPVINLKADVMFTGDGSYETPYVITTN